MDKTKYQKIFEMKNITKSHTHLAKVRAQDKNQQKLIMDLLGWNEMSWCQNQYDKGLEYLSCEVDGDQMGFDLLVKSRAFWSYWKNEWAKRDANFIHDLFDADDFDYITSEYQFIHSYEGIRATKRLELHQIEMDAIWNLVWKEKHHEMA